MNRDFNWRVAGHMVFIECGKSCVVGVCTISQVVVLLPRILPSGDSQSTCAAPGLGSPGGSRAA